LITAKKITRAPPPSVHLAVLFIGSRGKALAFEYSFPLYLLDAGTQMRVVSSFSALYRAGVVAFPAAVFLDPVAFAGTSRNTNLSFPLLHGLFLSEARQYRHMRSFNLHLPLSPLRLSSDSRASKLVPLRGPL